MINSNRGETNELNTGLAGFGRAACVASGVLLLFFCFVHYFRTQELTYATIFPVFLWLMVGLVTAAAGLALKRSVSSLALIVGWLIAGGVFGDSPWNLLRSFWPEDNQWIASRLDNNTDDFDRQAIRVLTLNCRKEPDALVQALLLDPDVLLLQETFRRQEFTALMEKKFANYKYAWNAGTAVLAKGKVIPINKKATEGNRYQPARIELPSGRTLNAVSLHLVSSPRRVDFWRSETWAEFARLQGARREQLSEIQAELSQSLIDHPTIFGGDFNAPAGNPIYDVMLPRFRDSWREAGRGWGKTSLNHYPIHRIDQIWISRELKASAVRAVKSQASDHRMVVCDLWLE